MENLSLVAVNNLIFLSKKDKFLANQYKLVNKEFIPSEEDDSYDTIYSFNDLEYPIYFSFHQVMNHIHNSYGYKIHGYTRNQLIYLMECAITTLLEYYDNVEEIDESFECLIEDLDDKVFIIHGYYKYGWCQWLPTKIKEYVNSICLQVIYTSKEITDEYIRYLKDPGGYSDEECDEESDGVDGDDGDDECSDGSSDNDDDNDEDDKKEN